MYISLIVIMYFLIVFTINYYMNFKFYCFNIRSAGVNVKSTCYSNDATQNYYEVQYSLAQEIGLEYCN